MVFAIGNVACIAQKHPDEPRKSSATEGYLNVQLKSFFATRVETVEDQGNAWLTANPKFKVVNVTLTSSPEPSQYYTQNSYPGFKYALIIAYQTK